MVDYGCLQLVTDGKPKFDCVTYVSILCGGTTSLPVVIPTDLSPDTARNVMTETASKLKYMSFVNDGLEGNISSSLLSSRTQSSTTLSYTEAEIKAFNNGSPPFPELPIKQNSDSLPVCDNCKEKVKQWWMQQHRKQWYSSKSFKTNFPHKLCKKCDKPKMYSQLLAAMSKKEGIEGPQKYKYYEIEQKTQ